MWSFSLTTAFQLLNLTNRLTFRVDEFQEIEAYYGLENYLRDMTHPIYSHNKHVVYDPVGDSYD